MTRAWIAMAIGVIGVCTLAIWAENNNRLEFVGLAVCMLCIQFAFCFLNGRGDPRSGEDGIFHNIVLLRERPCSSSVHFIVVREDGFNALTAVDNRFFYTAEDAAEFMEKCFGDPGSDSYLVQAVIVRFADPDGGQG